MLQEAPISPRIFSFVLMRKCAKTKATILILEGSAIPPKMSKSIRSQKSVPNGTAKKFTFNHIYAHKNESVHPKEQPSIN